MIVKRNQSLIKAVASIPVFFSAVDIAYRIAPFVIIIPIVHGNARRNPPNNLSLGSNRHVPVIRYFDIPHEELRTDNPNVIQKKYTFSDPQS